MEQDMSSLPLAATYMRDIAEKGDKAAFKQLFEHYAGRIKAFALKSPGIGGSNTLAEEIVQETMIRVWKKAALYDPGKANVDAWVFTIARNVRIDMQRKQQRQGIEIDADDLWIDSDQPEPLVQLNQRQIAENIHAGLAEINPEQAIILKKMYLEGKSQSQIANEFDIPLGTVKSRTRLALARLKLILSEKEL
jgi:RNA polymerase sigma-70 factor (ECF subfamily)